MNGLGGRSNQVTILGRLWSWGDDKEKRAGGAGLGSDPMMDAGMTGRHEVVGAGEPRRLSSTRDIEGGIDLRTLGAGTVVEARTKNSVYTVQLGTDGGMMLCGHPDHCPVLTPVLSVGSVLMTGEICDGYLAPGMRMEFRMGTRRVFTSKLADVRVKTRR